MLREQGEVDLVLPEFRPLFAVAGGFYLLVAEVEDEEDDVHDEVDEEDPEGELEFSFEEFVADFHFLVDCS